MANRKIMCILHDYLLGEKYEVTGEEANKESADLVEKINTKLNEEEKKDFEKLLDLWLEMECTSTEDNFVLGMRTGFQLALEVLDYGN